MKVFPKGMLDYEKVYTNEKYLSRFDISRLQKPDGFEDTKEYRDNLKDFLTTKSISRWSDIVQTEWMLSNFKYYNKRNKTISKYVNSHIALSIFTKEFVGLGYNFLTSPYYFNKIKSYFVDFYPDFYKNNPFKNPKKYMYPYKYISLDYLLVVYQMPERIEILKYADEHKMSFGVFLDFIINYIGKCNDTEEENVFLFMRPDYCPVYVKYLKK